MAARSGSARPGKVSGGSLLSRRPASSGPCGRARHSSSCRTFGRQRPLGRETPDRHIEALLAGAPAAVDVTLRSNSTSQWISADGTSVAIADQSTPTYSSYLRKTGAEPVLLGEGQPTGVSRDGRWLLALPVSGKPLLLHPTGAGQTRKLPNPDNLVFDSAAWLPDSRYVVMFGHCMFSSTHRSRAN